MTASMNRSGRQPITGPAAWRGQDLAESDAWMRRLSPDALAEIDGAVASTRRRGLAWHQVTRDSFPLPQFSAQLAEIGEELERGRGIALLRGLPVARYSDDELKLIFIGLCAHLGTAVPQSASGELLGEIRDEGADVGARRGQIDTAGGGQTFLSSRARVHTTGQLRFHTDRTDVVALLCVRPARSGGITKVASSVAIHNAMLARRPDLLELLFQDYPRSRFGEETKDPAQTYMLPVFAIEDGHFTSHYSRTYVEAGQLIPGVPRLTDAQWQALDLLHSLGEELCLEMAFEPGDMQLLNSHVTYHARTAYEDDGGPAQGRLLYRVWLSVPNSRPLPATHAVLWGRTEAGALRGGIGRQDSI